MSDPTQDTIVNFLREAKEPQQVSAIAFALGRRVSWELRGLLNEMVKGGTIAKVEYTDGPMRGDRWMSISRANVRKVEDE